MYCTPQLLLIGAVAAVGILHTVVPDHWMPIMLLARHHGWTRRETAFAALQAGLGHVGSTLLIAVVVWLAGIAFATSFGRLADRIASLALIGLGGWIAIGALRELRHVDAHNESPHPRRLDHKADRSPGAPHVPESFQEPSLVGDRLYTPLAGGLVAVSHAHMHRHDFGMEHCHWHDHETGATHVMPMTLSFVPLHDHRHRTPARTAMLLILGSSPMVEGIPAFFAAAKYGAALLLAMAFVFGLSTIATYIALCVYSTAGLQRVRLGPIERYGEVLSGALIALVGAIFLLFPVL